MATCSADTRGWPRTRRTSTPVCSERLGSLGVLVVAQRALRPAFGQGTDGARRRGWRPWWPGWRRRRRARDGPHVTRSAIHSARTIGHRLWRVPFSSVAACLPGAHERKYQRRNGADGPRSRGPLLRDLALVIALAAALAALTDYLLKVEVVSWLGKASRWCVSASSTRGLPLPRSCSRPCSAARSWSDRARRLGGQPRSRWARPRACLHCPGAMARHSSHAASM